ncbi:cupin domain-containing protein [Oscillospiraceae bacterium OttesenSCG-928-G22]|nr:cupin domain-containing protein [Oscillospiraceae bacterium OttesenSCG-928-G22]
MQDVYGKIRQIRQSRQMTLRDISSLTGLSLSFLSQVERGKCDITLTSLTKIARSMGINMRELFDDLEVSEKYYRPKHAQRRIETGHSFLEYYKVSSDFETRAVDVIRVYCKPHSKTEYAGHEGEECIYCLEGEITVTVVDEEYTLTPGDAIHFPSSLRHILENRSDKPFVMLIMYTQRLD